MKKDQKKIYFFLANNKEQAKSSPFMEGFYANHIPVIFTSVNVEEMIFQDIGSYKGFGFQNVETLNGNIPQELRDEEIVIDKEELPKSEEENFTIWIRSELTPGITNVKINKSLWSFPALISSPMTQSMRQ